MSKLISFEVPKLFGVVEYSDLFIDAVVRDGAGELLFASIFGRDSMILQLLAALTLPTTQGGRNRLTLIDADTGRKDHVMISHADRLEKLSGKLQTSVFGEVGHLWIYDPLAIQFDRANRRALLLRFNESDDSFAQRVWQTVQILSSVALLDHWRYPLLTALNDLVQQLSASSAPPIGAVDGARIELGDDFETIISISVASGALRLDASEQPADSVERIRQAAQLAKDKHTGGEQSTGETETGELSVVCSLFPLGQTVVTPGVNDLVLQGVVNPARLLSLHRNGDWGVVSAQDACSNQDAIANGLRIFSAYPIDPSLDCSGFGDNTIWVITEADRSSTTLLLPSEY